MGHGAPGEPPPIEPPPYPPPSPPQFQQGFIEMSCRITNHAAAQTLFGPFQLNTMGLSKRGKLESLGVSWCDGMQVLAYGGTFVEFYMRKVGTTQTHAQLINDYIFSGNNPSWEGELNVWPDDEVFCYVTDNQGTADFTVRIRGEYVA